MSATDQPVVSIVLPTHNGARFLRESIDSCLAQVYRSLELILVDDASTDATPDILAEYMRRDSRVFTIRNEKNLRLPQSLNVGFSRARGRYFTWTSDDNRYRPHAIKTMVYMLDHRPEVDLVYTDYSVIDNTGATVAYHLALTIERLVRVNCVGASFLYRRLVHETLNGFDAGKPLVEDYDFWLRAARWFHFEPLPLDLYEYRQHEGTLSTKHAADIRALNRLLLRDTLLQGGWVPDSARARASVALSRVTLSLGLPRDALADFWLGCRIAPWAVIAECAARASRYVFRPFLSD
jgi:glycosyltransferase involved in cell wall biosynthesis